MSNFYLMAGIQASLFLYILTGFFIRRLKLLSSETVKELSDIILLILLPCMIFDSFSQDLSLQQIASASVMLIVSTAICVFSYFLGKVIFNKYPASKRKILQYGTLIPNSVFAGLPVIQSAYGDVGFFLATIFTVPNRVFMWSAGISLFTDTDIKKKIQNVLLNPCIIALFLGAVRMILKIYIPDFLNTSIQKIGDCSMPLSLIVVGAILAEVDIRTIFCLDSLYASVVRLILIPAVVFVVLKLIGFDEVRMATAVILTGMPVGSSTAVLAMKYDADAELASKNVCLSTILSLFTIPVFSIFL